MPTDPSPNLMPPDRRLIGWPATRPGRWAVGLEAAFIALLIINLAVLMPSESEAWWQTILPFYAITMLICGLAGGIAGLISILRWGERSIFVWLTLLPGLWVIFMLLGELFVPH